MGHKKATAGQAGFHVFVGDPIAPNNTDARRFIARYLKKSSINSTRLELITTDNNPIVRVNKITDDAIQSRDFDPLSFLAALSSHIPDSWEQTTRYVGIYSARTRGAKRLNPAACSDPLPELEPPEKPSSYWAACMNPPTPPTSQKLCGTRRLRRDRKSF